MPRLLDRGASRSSNTSSLVEQQLTARELPADRNRQSRRRHCCDLGAGSSRLPEVGAWRRSSEHPAIAWLAPEAMARRDRGEVVTCAHATKELMGHPVSRDEHGGVAVADGDGVDPG